MDEKQAPHDEAAELSVIGSVLIAADKVFPLVGELAIDDFLTPYHREAWAAILAVQARRMPVDVISVGDELRARGMWNRFPGEGWSSWAVGVAANVNHPQHAGNHADVVRDKARLRKLIALAVEVQSAAYGNQPSVEVMERARSGLGALEVIGGGDGPHRIGDLIQPALDEIDARQSGAAAIGIPTGIGSLDDILGAMRPERMHILAGRPGDGKTSLAATICRNVAVKGFPVLFFPREVGRQGTVEHNLSIESGVPAFDIASARLDVQAWKKLQDAGGRLAKTNLWIDDRSSTIEAIMAQTRKWHALQVMAKAKEGQPRPLGLMALDYLQLARLSRAKSNANREQVVAEMSRALKELAMELGIPLLILSQLNRAAEASGGRPLPSHLRESGSLEQDADVILFVYRDIPVEDKAKRRESGPAEVIVGKHKGGPTGVADVYFHTPRMMFTDLETYRQEPEKPNWQDGRRDLE